MTIKVDKDKLIYDDITDTLFVRLGEKTFTDEEEVSPGIHVLYKYDRGRKDDIVAIEIEYFTERFSGSFPVFIEIPSETPFRLELPIMILSGVSKENGTHKNCPAGHERELLELPYYYDTDQLGYGVRCTDRNCNWENGLTEGDTKCYGKGIEQGVFGLYKTEEEAWIAWDTRADEDTPQEHEDDLFIKVLGAFAFAIMLVAFIIFAVSMLMLVASTH